MATVTRADDPRLLPGILRLSPATRRRIYWHAGLGPGYESDGLVAPVCYNLDGGNCSKPGSSGHDIYFHGLLLTCRTIHDEAVALLYSANLFTIRYQPGRSLASLRALTPPALAHLVTLRVVLNQALCHQKNDGYYVDGHCCLDSHGRAGTPPVQICRSRWHKDLHDLSLAQPDRMVVETMLKEWDATLVSLAPHIPAGRLDLALVCDVCPDNEGVEIARRLVASLGVLPRLKDCHIRLCAARYPQLEALAHEAALQARGLVAPTSQPAPLPAPAGTSYSRLLLLPSEIRLRILEYTDLIAPWKEVYWSRGRRGYWISVVPCMPHMVCGKCPPEYHHGCRFIQCSSPEWPEPTIGCFCRRVHATITSTCRCWEAPTSLFLVCRTLYRDACLTFYNGNRFIVLDSAHAETPRDWWPAGPYPHATFAASEFLRAVVPPHCVSHLRFLELVWAPFCRADWPQAGHAALQEWPEAIDWARDRLNLPGLTLRLVVATSAGWGHEEEHREMTRAEGDAVLAGYWRIMEPLARLGASREDGTGLARFYATMAWPWRWCSWVRQQQMNEKVPYVWVLSKDKRLKERAERFIMGPRYEQVCTGPGLLEESIWKYSCARHC